MKFHSVLSAFVLAAGGATSSVASPSTERLNVLLIVCDDLNDWVGDFAGNPQALTPNLDRFAANGAIVFQQAYCPAPVCNPSRTAFLSGFAPHRTGLYGNSQNMLDSELLQTHATLPEYFAKHGYATLSRGKIFHMGGEWAFQDWVNSGAAIAVDRSRLTSRLKDLVDGQPGPGSVQDEENVDFAWGPTKTPKVETRDYRTALWAADKLRQPPADQPFFMAVGFTRPHLPWYVPQEYFDRHPLETIKIPEHRMDDLDDILDSAGNKRFSPTADFRWVKQDPTLFKKAVQAYLASTSYVDDCLGIIFDALAKSPARDRTIVIICGDHGWHLGEKLRFRKTTLWAESTRLPFILRMPGMTARRESSGVINLQDIYPTLIDLCRLPPKEIDGRSFAPLVEQPDRAWPYPTVTSNLNGNAAVRDERWHFIQYKGGTEEFYDMHADPMQ